MIEQDAIRKLLLEFRDESLSRFPEDIDPMSTEGRQSRLGQTQKHHLITAFLAGIGNEPLDDLAALLDNPRVLKYVLRRVDGVWSFLHGEIDFDDLLVALTLMTAAPQTFAFIVNHLSEIRNLATDRPSYWKDTRAELKELWEKSGIEMHGESEERLLAFLFPSWKQQHSRSAIDCPQGVRHSHPCDYWIRLQEERIRDNEIRDQFLFRIVRLWQDNHTAVMGEGETLAQLLVNSRGVADRLEHFGFLLNAEDIRGLASQVFGEMLRIYGVGGNRDSCQAFLDLWRISLDEPWSSHETWVADEIEKALPVSLRFANDIYYFWRNQSHSDVRGHPPYPALRDRFVKTARHMWESDVSILIKSLDPTFRYSLYHFAAHYSEKDMGGTGFVPSEWQWFGHLIVEGCRREPRVFVPQALTFLVRQLDSSEPGLAFNFKIGTDLFGNAFPDVMEMLASGTLGDGHDEETQRYVLFAQQQARQWLTGQEQQSSSTEGNAGEKDHDRS